MRPLPKAAAPIPKNGGECPGHRVTAGKLANPDGHFLLTEFLDVNAHTTEMGSGLSFAYCYTVHLPQYLKAVIN